MNINKKSNTGNNVTFLSTLNSDGSDSIEINEKIECILAILHSTFNSRRVFIYLLSPKNIWLLQGTDDILKKYPMGLENYIHKIFESKILIENSVLYEAHVKYDQKKDKNISRIEHGDGEHSLIFMLQYPGENIKGILCIQDNYNRVYSDTDKSTFLKFGHLIRAELYNYEKISVKENRLPEIELDYKNFLNVYDSYKVIKDKTDILLKDRGITYKEWRVLNGVINSGKAVPKVISDHAHLSKPLVSRYLKSLEEKGLINRLYCEKNDKRYVYIECTEEGKEIWDYGVKHIMSFIRKLYSSVTGKVNAG